MIRKTDTQNADLDVVELNYSLVCTSRLDTTQVEVKQCCRKVLTECCSLS